MMTIGLCIAELWVDKLGWGQIPFSQHLSSLPFGVYCGNLACRQWSMTVSWICTDSLSFFGVGWFVLLLFGMNMLVIIDVVDIRSATWLNSLRIWINGWTSNIDCVCRIPHNFAKMEFDPTPTYRPITPRYLIRFSSLKIWWHDNMLTYAHTKYWIHPITSY